MHDRYPAYPQCADHGLSLIHIFLFRIQGSACRRLSLFRGMGILPQRRHPASLSRPGSPVSYTHLDVYKRQAICRKSIAATSEEEEEEEEGAAAVSAQRLRTRRAEMSLAPLDSVEHFAHEML